MMTSNFTRDSRLLTDEECGLIDEFRRLTPAQQAEAIELLREWTKDKEPAGEERTD
jgi:hypothetical protein